MDRAIPDLILVLAPTRLCISITIPSKVCPPALSPPLPNLLLIVPCPHLNKQQLNAAHALLLPMTSSSRIIKIFTAKQQQCSKGV